MVRPGLAGLVLGFALAGTSAFAQSGPPLPTMPRPPSFDDASPSEAKGRKPARRTAKQTGAPAAPGGSATSFERPSKFVPAEFDGPRGGGAGGGARPMMTDGGRPGMGMRF